MIGYIYKITNSINGMFYIGSTINIEKRWRHHLNELKSHCHHNMFLSRAFEKYGEESFELTYKEINVSDENELRHIEERYINFCWNSGKLYNLSKKGGGGDLTSYHPLLEEIKEKQRKASLENWANKTDEYKKMYSEKMRGEGNPNYGNRWTDAQKKNLSKKLKEYYSEHDSYNKGKTFEELFGNEVAKDLKAKISEMAKNRIGEKNPFYGKHHNEETKEKLRKAHLGRKTNNSKKVLYNGVIYDSVRDCANTLGLNECVISYRCRQNIYGFSYYGENDTKPQREARVYRHDYSEEHIINELKKYKTRKELKEKDSKLYHYISSHKELAYLLIENLYELRHRWTIEEVIGIAKKYQSYKDFRSNEPRVYSTVKNRKWIDIVKKVFVNN